MLKLRYMTRRDIPRVMDIEERCFTSPWDDGCFLGELGGPLSHCMVLCDDELVVGYAVYRIVLDETHLLNIAVDPERRKAGLGRMLMNHLLAHSQEEAASIIWLEVRPSNRPARTMYESFGFQQVDVRRCYYTDSGEDALILALPLTYDDEDGNAPPFRGDSL